MTDKRTSQISPDVFPRDIVTNELVEDKADPNKLGAVVSDADWEAALAQIEALPEEDEAPKAAFRPPIIQRTVTRRSEYAVTDLDLAKQAVTMRDVGLQANLSSAQRARVADIDARLTTLRGLVTKEQFDLLLGMLRRDTGDIRAALAGMEERIRAGTFFSRPVAPKPRARKVSRKERRAQMREKPPRGK